MDEGAGLMGTAEAGQYLGFSQYWVQTRAKGLGIPYLEINGRYYFRQVDLDEWLFSRRQAQDGSSSEVPGRGRNGKPLKIQLSQKKSA
jgi:hypothetical protein